MAVMPIGMAATFIAILVVAIIFAMMTTTMTHIRADRAPPQVPRFGRSHRTFLWLAHLCCTTT